MQHFWPLPRSWEGKIWTYSWANKARTLSVGFRLALLKTKLRLLGFFAPNKYKNGPTMTFYEKYLTALQNKVETKNSAFFVLYAVARDNLNSSQTLEKEENPNIVAWYDPEWVASLFAPWSQLTKKDREAYVTSMLALGDKSIDSTDEYLQNQSISLTANPTEYHFTEKAANQYGEILAKKLFPLLKLKPAQ